MAAGRGRPFVNPADKGPTSMTWENVLTLLHVAHMSNEYGGLVGLRDAAVAKLKEADPASLTFNNATVEEDDD